MCCTSANAVQIVNRFPRDQKISSSPTGTSAITWRGRPAEETMILWQGWCHVHDDFRAARSPDPGGRPVAVLMAARRAAGRCWGSPAWSRHVRDAAVPRTSDATTFIVATQPDLSPARNPVPGQRSSRPRRRAVCPNMKLTTLEESVATLDDEWDDVLDHRSSSPARPRGGAARRRAMLEEGSAEGRGPPRRTRVRPQGSRGCPARQQLRHRDEARNRCAASAVRIRGRRAPRGAVACPRDPGR